MKVEFKRSDIDANHEQVFVNQIAEGEFYFDTGSQSFVFTPVMGQQIVLPPLTYDDARQWLIGKLSHMYD